MFCSNCGTQMADGSSFCPNCGQPVAAAGQQAGAGGYAGTGGYAEAGPQANGKEKKPFFDEMTFNDAQYARDVAETERRKMERSKIGMLISLGAVISYFIGISLLNSTKEMNVAAVFGFIFLFTAMAATVVSYIVGGGLLMAFKIAGKITFWAWFLVPFFPADVIIGLVGLGLAIYSIIMLPIVYTFIMFMQHRKNYNSAMTYLSYCNVPVR